MEQNTNMEAPRNRSRNAETEEIKRIDRKRDNMIAQETENEECVTTVVYFNLPYHIIYQVLFTANIVTCICTHSYVLCR